MDTAGAIETRDYVPDPHPSHLGYSNQPLPAAPEPGPDGFMDQSGEETLAITFKVTTYGRKDNETRADLARRMLKEMRLRFGSDVEPGGLKVLP